MMHHTTYKLQFPSVTWIIPNLKRGDQRSWNSLCQQFETGLTSKATMLLRSNREASLAPSDLVQESFLKAWNKRNSFRGESTAQFAAWMIRILNNCFLDHCKSKQAKLLAGTWHECCGADCPPIQDVISAEREAILHACIAALPKFTQQVICLRHFQGLKLHEIASHLNVSSNEIAGKHRRGLEQLRKLLKKRVYSIDSP